MSRQKTQTVADEFARAAELIEELGLLRTLEDVPREHIPRQVTPHGSCSVRATIATDMVKDAEIGVDGAFQPCIYTGGAPLVIDEPCVILRSHPDGGKHEPE